MFNLFLANLDMPQVISRQVSDASDSGSCDLYLSWNLPSNIARPNDVSHFIVRINGTHFTNETTKANESSILTVYRLCSCGSHNINISAVSRCGSVGESALTIVNQLSIPQSTMECQSITTPTCTNECQGTVYMCDFV